LKNSDVDVVGRRVDGDIGGAKELARPAALAAELGEVGPLGVEALHPVLDESTT
jgi:hypothetical protein